MAHKLSHIEVDLGASVGRAGNDQVLALCTGCGIYASFTQPTTVTGMTVGALWEVAKARLTERHTDAGLLSDERGVRVGPEGWQAMTATAQHHINAWRIVPDVHKDDTGRLVTIYCPLCPWPPPHISQLAQDGHLDLEAWLHKERYDRPTLCIEWSAFTPINADAGEAIDSMTDAYTWSWRVMCDRGDEHVLLTHSDVTDEMECPRPPTLDEVLAWLRDRTRFPEPEDA